MRNVVMGTAGHIDHGKTSLVKYLTGIDTDRLEEEKRRGMTIELGFANLKLPSGKTLSIVDVPGHEKFIKSMVAGVSGIDFVVLVVAADEGIMPQTREHLDILSLLDINKGVIALSKSDLVDSAWLKMVTEEIREEINSSKLKDVKIIPVSSCSGEGIDLLLEEISRLAQESENIQKHELFRLPIDRVFTIGGHGTVITGTVLGGKISKGQKVRLLPSLKEGKVRGVQVHNKAVEAATGGDRCAINLLGIDKDDISRGEVVVCDEWMKSSNLMDAVVYTVKGKGDLKHNQRVHINIGTKEVLARVRVIGEDSIKSSSKGYIQLRFEEPVMALRGDKFIIRSFSPTTTIAGGKILLHSTRNRQRFVEETRYQLELLEKGRLEKLVLDYINNTMRLVTLEEICQTLICKEEEVTEKINSYVEDGSVLDVNTSYLSKKAYDNYIALIRNQLRELNKANPYRFEIDKEEIKSKIFKEFNNKDFTNILELFVSNNDFILENNRLRNYDEELIKKISNEKQVQNIDIEIKNLGYNVKTVNQLKTLFNNKDIEEILKFLTRTNKLINLGEDTLVHSDVFNAAYKVILTSFEKGEKLTVSSLRDELGCGRKATMILLEYCDSLGRTKRDGDFRVPGENLKNSIEYIDNISK